MVSSEGSSANMPGNIPQEVPVWDGGLTPDEVVQWRFIPSKQSELKDSKSKVFIPKLNRAFLHSYSMVFGWAYNPNQRAEIKKAKVAYLLQFLYNRGIPVIGKFTLIGYSFLMKGEIHEYIREDDGRFKREKVKVPITRGKRK